MRLVDRELADPDGRPSQLLEELTADGSTPEEALAEANRRIQELDGTPVTDPEKKALLIAKAGLKAILRLSIAGDDDCP